MCHKPFARRGALKDHLVLSHQRWYPCGPKQKFELTEEWREPTEAEMEETRQAARHKATPAALRSPQSMTPRFEESSKVKDPRRNQSCRESEIGMDIDVESPQARMISVVERMKAAASSRETVSIDSESSHVRKNPNPTKLGPAQIATLEKEFRLEPIEFDKEHKKKHEAIQRHRDASLASATLPFSEEQDLRGDLESMQQEILRNPLLLGIEVIQSSASVSEGGAACNVSKSTVKNGSLRTVRSLSSGSTMDASEEALFTPDPVTSSKKSRDKEPAKTGKSAVSCTVSKVPVRGAVTGPTESCVELRGSVMSPNTRRVRLDKLLGCWDPEDSRTVIGHILDQPEPWVATRLTQQLQEIMFPCGELGPTYGLVRHTLMTYQSLILTNQLKMLKSKASAGVDRLSQKYVEVICGADVDPFWDGPRMDQAPGCWTVGETSKVINHVLRHRPPWNAARLTQSLVSTVSPDIQQGHLFGLIRHVIVALKALTEKSRKVILENEGSGGSYILHTSLLITIGGADFGAVATEDV